MVEETRAIKDRRGEVWEDPRGWLHLVVQPPRFFDSLVGVAVFHKTLLLLSEELSNLTDRPDFALEDRAKWKRHT